LSEFVDYGDNVIFIREGQDTSWIHTMQDTYDQMGLTSRLFYVPVDSCSDKYLHPHRFICNPQQPLSVLMDNDGIVDSVEQMDYMIKKIRHFQNTDTI
jgi:hypothetical protein